MFVYEIAHRLLGCAIDPWDLLATVGAGIIAALFHRLMYGPVAASDDRSVVVANRAASVDA